MPTKVRKPALKQSWNNLVSRKNKHTNIIFKLSKTSERPGTPTLRTFYG